MMASRSQIFSASAITYVAASNSKSPITPDYTCTGTDDQTTINTALTAAAGNGPRRRFAIGNPCRPASEQWENERCRYST